MQDFVSSTANKLLREELGRKQEELMHVFNKISECSNDFVRGAPRVLADELEKKVEEMMHVFSKILKSNKPEDLRDLIVLVLQPTRAQQDRQALPIPNYILKFLSR